MYEFTCKDINGIPRTYGKASTETGAIYECWEAAKEYVRRRPDTGPLSGWAIERNDRT